MMETECNTCFFPTHVPCLSINNQNTLYHTTIQ